MLTDFQNSFTGRLSGKFAANSYLNIPLHLKYVATLPCEISIFKKSPCSRSNSSKLPSKTYHSKNSFKMFVWQNIFFFNSLTTRRSHQPYKKIPLSTVHNCCMPYTISSWSVIDGVSLSVSKSKLVYSSLIFVDY